MPVTLKELAYRAGVHPSTISRIVNNDPVLRVRPATRERVEALLRETQYQPDGVARSLRLRQTSVLAMIIPDITNPFFASVFLGLEEAANGHGYSVVLANTGGSKERELTHLVAMRSRRVDGVVLASVFLRDPSVSWLKQQEMRYVLVDRFSNARDPFVGADNRLGGLVATRHLIGTGHRRIAHLAGPSNVSTALLRREGYVAALEEAGMQADPALIVQTDYSQGAGRAMMEGLLRLDSPPTAVFAANDMAAIGAHAAALEAGLRIPEEFAIVGYNDSPLASWIEPPLTTMRVPSEEFGRQAAEILIEEIEGRHTLARRLVLEPELIIRRSTIGEPAPLPRDVS